MLIKQISVFVENKPGRLYKLTKTLAEHGIDLKAISIADTEKFGILRMIVEEPEKTLQIIKDANFTASVTEVLGVEVQNRPGGLAEVLRVFTENDISVEYLYSFVGTQCEDAMIILRVDDAPKAHQLLQDSGFSMITKI